MRSSLIEKINNCNSEVVAIIFVNDRQVAEMHFEPWDITYDEINGVININYEGTDVVIDLCDAVITKEEDELSELFGSYDITVGPMEVYIDF